MATLPTFEKILLEVHQSLGISQKQTNQKNRFAEHLNTLNKHEQMLEIIIDELCTATEIDDLDEEALDAFIFNLYDTAICYTELYSKVYTFNANKQNIIWHLLGFYFAPSLARLAAFWNFPQLDKGMPRGRFWYLPDRYMPKKQGELYLPIPQVMDWFFDLWGKSPREYAEFYGREFNKHKTDSVERMFNKWQNGVTPEVVTIQEYFRDDLKLEFSGCFELKGSLSLQEKYQAAKEFINKKNLNAKELHAELLLNQIPDEESEDWEKAYFVKWVAERYQKPTNKIIRRRFLMARMFQDGYIRLLKFLFPNVSLLCMEPFANKLLQIIDIYQIIYNLTVHSRTEVGDTDSLSEFRENKYFEEKLIKESPFDYLTLFSGILPSDAYKNRAISELSQVLTQYFDWAGKELPDFLVYAEYPNFKAVEYKLKYITYYAELAEDIKRIKGLLNNPEALEQENNFEALHHVYKDLNRSRKKSFMKYLEKNAKTDREKMYVILEKLHDRLNRHIRQVDDCIQVENLLKQAESNTESELWNAPILKYKASHALYQNKFDEALELFKQALEAGKSRHFGIQLSEIARDCLALAVSMKKIDHKTQEKFYRTAVNGGILQYKNSNLAIYSLFLHPPVSFENYAQYCCKYFLENLYKPYLEYKYEQPRTHN